MKTVQNITKHYKTSLLLIIVSFTFINKLSAQLKVYSNNNIQIGPIWSTNLPTTRLFLNGDAYFNCYPAIGGFSFLNYQNTFGGNTYNDPALIPQHNNGMWLGNNTTQFYRMYSNEIYANQTYIGSDENIKTNIRSYSGDSALSKIYN